MVLLDHILVRSFFRLKGDFAKERINIEIYIVHSRRNSKQLLWFMPQVSCLVVFHLPKIWREENR